MRPSLLDPLFTPLARLPGVGPKLATLYDRLLRAPHGQPARIVDLLFHVPVDQVDRRLSPSVRDAPFDQIVTLKVVVEQYNAPRSRHAPHKVIVGDGTGDLALAFFD
ncbi:MAG: ATP-dependent DNA helicase RecG, partial [Beijerinckiaceae bacterium]|nr:ATP-dependent DNA helicase RecG [Beijerinckiaceae bacterium]